MTGINETGVGDDHRLGRDPAGLLAEKATIDTTFDTADESAEAAATLTGKGWLSTLRGDTGQGVGHGPQYDLSVNTDGLPVEWRESGVKAFCAWKLGKADPRTGKQRKIAMDPRTLRPPRAGKKESPIDQKERRSTLDYALMRTEGAEGAAVGVGIVLGVIDGLTCIDLDNCLDGKGTLAGWAAPIVQAAGATMVEVSTSGRGLHIFVRGELPTLGAAKGPPGVEIYSGKRYIALTGRLYAGRDGQSVPEVAEVSDTLRRALAQSGVPGLESWGSGSGSGGGGGGGGGGGVVDNDDLCAGVAEGFVLPKVIGQGQRDDTLAKYVGQMVQQGLGDAEIRAKVEQANAERCNPPLPEHDIDRLVGRAEGFRAKDAEQAEQAMTEANDGQTPETIRDKGGILASEDLVRVFNERFSLAFWGKAVVLDHHAQEEHGYVRVYTKEDFGLLHGNVRVIGQGRDRGSAPGLWLKAKGRRTYRDVVFRPEERPGEVSAPGGSVLNLWPGFAVEEQPGDWSLLERHIRDHIAGGDEAVAEYILNWTALLFQRPWEMPRVALILQSRLGGTGKGVFMSWLRAPFDKAALLLTRRGALTDKHNDDLEGKVLVCADETIAMGAENDTLKSMLTEETFTVEPKYRGRYPARNMMSLVIATNQGWVVDAKDGGRRYLVTQVSEKHRDNPAYYNPLVAQAKDGGVAAMFHDLRRRDISKFDPRRRPGTRGNINQLLESADPLDAYVVEMLQTNCNRPHSVDDEVGDGATMQGRPGWGMGLDERAPYPACYEDFMQWCKASRKQATSKREFTHRLVSVYGVMRGKTGGHRTLQFPGRQVMKKRLSRRLGISGSDQEKQGADV